MSIFTIFDRSNATAKICQKIYESTVHSMHANNTFEQKHQEGQIDNFNTLIKSSTHMQHQLQTTFMFNFVTHDRL